MSEEQTEFSKQDLLIPREWVSLLLTLTLTPLAAVILSEFGYIPMNAIYAATYGFLFALLSVLIRVGNVKRVENLKAKAGLKDDRLTVGNDLSRKRRYC
ncbi:MAG: hypothetical protein ACW97A_11860 [Candidatus Thorarchaeota archaeon]|jgi:hypothetical protein